MSAGSPGNHSGEPPPAPAEWTAPSWPGPPGGESGPPPGGQYSYPSSVYYNPAGQRTNPAAIAALVCGIVQFPLGLVLLNILLAIPAIICGAIGLRQTTRRGEGGRGMAIAGLVLGILGIAYFAIMLLLGIVFLSLAHPSAPPAGP